MSDLPGYIERGGEMTSEDWKQAAKEARRDREHLPVAVTDQQSAEVEALERIIEAYPHQGQSKIQAVEALRALAQQIETLKEQIRQRDEHEHDYDKEIETLRREREAANEYLSGILDTTELWRARAERAEAQRDRAVEALREIVEEFRRGVPRGYDGPPKYEEDDPVVIIARRVLAEIEGGGE